MGTSAQNVLSGAPDQLTTGAILSAALPPTVAKPTDMFTATLTGFDDSGYVSEDGVAMSISKSFAAIKDWSGSVVKRILEEFDGTIKYSHLEVSEYALQDTFGESAVTITAPTATKGTRIEVAIGADDMPHKQRVFRMKDGAKRVVIYLPDSQVTELEEITFVKTDAIKLGVTVSCYPDAAGKSIYILTDDGVFSA